MRSLPEQDTQAAGSAGPWAPGSQCHHCCAGRRVGRHRLTVPTAAQGLQPALGQGDSLLGVSLGAGL